MGVKVTVVMPKSGSDLMRKLIEQEGAEVKLQGQTLDEAISAALELGNKEGAVYIPPYDHPDIWKGHSTMVDEIIKDGVTPEAVVLAVGGGGLLCGVLEGLHRHGCYNVPVLALEPEGASSLYESVGQHKLVGIDAVKTIALSLAAKKVAQEAFEWTNRHPVDVQLVSDQTALKSCVRFATDHRVLVEPACGVALAGIYENLIRFENTHSIVVIVCGGANVSLQLINEWQKRIK
jgi:L-serine/L-threonine ammonia-lyase